MIAIISAMDLETKLLVDKLSNKKSHTLNHYKVYTGLLSNKEVVIATSGIGKVNAAILLTSLLNEFNLDSVINIGLCGGVKGHVGDIVCIDKCLYGDVEVLPRSDYQYGQIPDLPAYFSCKLIEGINFGDIITTDKFMDDRAYCDELISKYFSNYNVVAFDMESAAFSQVCYLSKIPFTVLRVISDIVGESKFAEYLQMKEQVANSLCEKVENIIKKYQN